MLNNAVFDLYQKHLIKSLVSSVGAGKGGAMGEIIGGYALCHKLILSRSRDCY